MSAKIFNPLVMSEMRRMISRNSCEAVGSVESPAVRVKRNLFGPVNHEENLSFLDRELAAIQTLQSERWGFDFVRETPLPAAATKHGFVWERVKPEDNVPEAYALRQLSILNQQNKISQAAEPADSVQPASNHRTRNSKQSQITDYLKKRKRSLSAGDITAHKLAAKSTTVAQASEPATRKRSRTRNS